MPPKFDAGKVAEIHQHLHSHLPSESALRIKALETLLVDKGLVNPQTIDAWIEAYTDQIGPKRGARVVARAWMDNEYRKRLLQDAPAAIDELGYLGKATRTFQGCRKYRPGAQPGGVHAVLLLPVFDSRSGAGLVQGRSLSFARGA